MAFNLQLKKPQSFVRVNFTNRGFSKIIQSRRSLHTETTDRDNLVQLASLWSDIKIEKKTAIETKSIPELLGIDYIGYIVDKERLSKATGDWDRIDEYRIIGSETANFKDSRVAYGETYRYRIKSIIKMTFAITKEITENLELTEDVKRFQRDQFKKNLRARESVIASIDRIANIGLQSKVSTGKSVNKFELIKGFTIQVTDQKTRLVKSSIFDAKSRIRRLRLLKNLRLDNKLDVGTGKAAVSPEVLKKLFNKAIQNFRSTTVEYVSRYYESDPSKNWVYVHITESEPPPPPSAIKITPNSTREEMMLTWLKPGNSQRDTEKFRIYHRNKVGEEWNILATVPERENLFVQKFDVNKKHIFAISSIDAHGIESFLSTQAEAQFNSNFRVEQREKDLKYISGPGTKPDEINLILRKFFEPKEFIIAKKRITIKPTKEFADATKDVVIKVTSLDSHEKKEFKVRLENLNIRNDEE